MVEACARSQVSPIAFAHPPSSSPEHATTGARNSIRKWYIRWGLYTAFAYIVGTFRLCWRFLVFIAAAETIVWFLGTARWAQWRKKFPIILRIKKHALRTLCVFAPLFASIAAIIGLWLTLALFIGLKATSLDFILEYLSTVQIVIWIGAGLNAIYLIGLVVRGIIAKVHSGRNSIDDSDTLNG